ncbi:Protein of unknown function [Pyronema omphalodes CBS 100304]|uniref:Uncharacterized protein n=1 Tax=Pyronema omphalodes (strain CBS 100304) TaxID=1076935 RepID=U4KW84_PYROM|nr:Protein of unknown function [Pyronema omphalodes CBS 100304]
MEIQIHVPMQRYSTSTSTRPQLR